MNNQQRGKDIWRQGKSAEDTVLSLLLSYPKTTLVSKLAEGNGIRPCDYIWIKEASPRLFEVKSTKEYKGNIKRHQIEWMLELNNKVPCFYIFVIEEGVYMVSVVKVAMDLIRDKKVRYEPRYQDRIERVL